MTYTLFPSAAAAERICACKICACPLDMHCLDRAKSSRCKCLARSSQGRTEPSPHCKFRHSCHNSDRGASTVVVCFRCHCHLHHSHAPAAVCACQLFPSLLVLFLFLLLLLLTLHIFPAPCSPDSTTRLRVQPSAVHSQDGKPWCSAWCSA